MRPLIERVAAAHAAEAVDAAGSPVEPDLVLVVGAGTGADLASWRALRARRLVVLEPQPSMARGLSVRLRAAAGESLLEAALVTDGSPTARLHVLNNPRESGLSHPSGLGEHFPSVRLREIQEVPAVGLAQILGALDSDEPALDLAPDLNEVLWPSASVLIAEAPSVVASIARDSAHLLVRFEWLALRCGEVPLFEGDVDAAVLHARLEALGYERILESQDAIPPFVECLYRRGSLVEPLWQARLEAARAVAARDTLVKEKTDLTAARDALAMEKAGLTAARDALAKEKLDLVAARDALAKEMASLQAQLDDSRRELETARQQLKESTTRQQLMQEEQVKSEAQIELIKDFLLREPSL